MGSKTILFNKSMTSVTLQKKIRGFYCRQNPLANRALRSSKSFVVIQTVNRMSLTCRSAYPMPQYSYFSRIVDPCMSDVEYVWVVFSGACMMAPLALQVPKIDDL